MTQRVVSYIRVSTEEQAEEGYSVASQERFLTDYASGHDLCVVETFAESESAARPGRGGFGDMVELLEKDRSITGVLIYKMDRVSRNLTDYAYLVEKLGMVIISATEEFPNNATGRFMGDIHAVMARYFSAQLSERVRDAMHEKARQGIYPSLAPLGYLNDPETRTIYPDPRRARMISELHETYVETDMSLRELTAWAKKRGLRTRKGNAVHRTGIHAILTNPIYKGIVRWGSVVADGKHEPIVSKYLFDRVQEKLHGRSRRRQSRRFPFRGSLVCGHCGCRITASLAKGKYVYYHCTKGRGKCQQPYIRQEKLSDLLFSVVDNVRIPQEIVAKLLAEIRSGETARREKLAQEAAEIRKEREQLDLTRKKAYIDKLNGGIANQRWRALDKEWAEQDVVLADRLAVLEEGLKSSAADSASEAFELLEHASELFSEQSPEEQAKGLRILVSNLTLTGEKVEPNYRKPFDLVAEGRRTGVWYA